MTERSRRPRVFIGLTEVAGYYSNLAAGFGQLGIEATFLNLGPDPFEYARTHAYASFERQVQKVRARARDNRSGRVAAAPWVAVFVPLVLARYLLRAWLFLGVAVAHDVFIFNGGETFLRHGDLRLLRAFGKTVICVFNGSDHRPPYLNGRAVRRAQVEGFASLARETRIVRTRVEAVERSSDQVVALAASAQFHTRPFVSFLAVGIPFPDGPCLQRPEVEPPGKVRILHSPSDPVSKGTDRIRAAVRRLTEAGLAIEYVELRDRPNREVLEAIGACDLVVDELYSDTPLAGLGTEAAALGRPVLVCGYYADWVHREIPESHIPPSAFVHPDAFEAELERLVLDRERRQALGRAASAYVRERWSPRAVAERFLALANDDVSADWIIDPSRLEYVHGWGLEESMLTDAVAGILEVAGTEGLCLKGRPNIERALLELSGQSPYPTESDRQAPRVDARISS